MHALVIVPLLSALLFQSAIATARSFSDTLAITALGGELSGLQKGVIYMAQPDPRTYGDSLIIFPRLLCENGKSFRIVAQADSGSLLSLKIDLPTSLRGYGFGDSLPCNFTPIGMVRASTNEFLNPNDAHTFQIPASGVDTFHIGVRITVPPGIPADLYEDYLRCYVRNIETGDSTEASASYLASVLTPIATDASEGTIDDLLTNITYTLDPESDTVTPIVGGSEAGSAMKFSISGEPGSIVLVFFHLPNALSGPTTIPCSFSQTSGYDAGSGSRFNPNFSSLSFFLPPVTGNLDLRLGISVTIPLNAPVGEYSDTLFVSTCYSGIRHTSKEGISTSSCDCDYAFAMYTVHVGGATGVERVESLPETFALHRNFPNPFNPGTTIRFDLPEKTFITLRIYDILGQEVATLVNEKREAGRHEIRFDGSKLPSGMYFYQLRTDNFLQTMKLLLVK